MGTLGSLFKPRVSIYGMYYKIAQDHANRHRDLGLKLLDLGHHGTLDEQWECYIERKQAAVVSIAFAGMSLEAFFYDYAAETLSDKFVTDHLDKLDLKSKFSVYSKLVCGKAPNKSVCDEISGLVRLRNQLVHFKSKSFPIDESHKASDFLTELDKQLENGVDQATKCVVSVMKELGRLHGKPSFFVSKMQVTF